ncbi:MAG: TIGR01841 family phasin [Pseudomonadota bacterium]
MLPIQDQLSVVTKTNLETQFATTLALASKTLESAEKLFELNINAVRATLEESSATTRQFMAAKDPQELFSLMTAQIGPNAEKAVSYGRHLANIASGTQAEFARATESQLAQANSKLNKVIEDAARRASAGSENAVAMVKSAIENASSSYEHLSKVTRQAGEAMGASLNAAADQIVLAADNKSLSQ